MIFSFNDNGKKKDRKFEYIIILILAFIAIYFFYDFKTENKSNYFNEISSYIIYPFLSLQLKFDNILNYFPSILSDKKKLLNYVEFLKEENEDLKAKIIEFKSQEYFFEKNEELLEFKKKYDLKQSILAQIVSRSFSGEHFYLIDKGENHGVLKDMAAIYKNCLIGKVSEIYPLYSKITLISDLHCSVSAYCSKTKTHGIFQGNSDISKYKLLHVGHMNQLQKDDLLFSSGDGLVFPEGFLLGFVDDIEPMGVCYSISIKPAINLSDLKCCHLIKKSESNSKLFNLNSAIEN